MDSNTQVPESVVISQDQWDEAIFYLDLSYRADTPWRVIVNGYRQLGSIRGALINDQTWGLAFSRFFKDGDKLVSHE